MDRIFKQLVNSASSSLSSNFSSDLTDLYEHYKLDYKNSLKLDQVFRYLYKIIQDSLSGNCIHISELFILKDHLILAHLVKKEQLQPYLEILEIIIDAVHENNSKLLVNQLISLNAEDKWRVALQAALDLISKGQFPAALRRKNQR